MPPCCPTGPPSPASQGRQISEPLARKVAPSPGEEKPKKYIKQYEMGDILGRGSYAKVKKCRDVDTNAEYAIKIFKKSLLKKNKSRYSGTQLDDVLRPVRRQRGHVLRLYTDLAFALTTKLVLEGRVRVDRMAPVGASRPEDEHDSAVEVR